MTEGDYQTSLGWDNDEDAIYDCSALHPLETPDGCWRTSSGEFIEISRMTDPHLRNAIAFSKRKKLDGAKLGELERELERRS